VGGVGGHHQRFVAHFGRIQSCGSSDSGFADSSFAGKKYDSGFGHNVFLQPFHLTRFWHWQGF
jgi:hypothetical protein